MAEYTKKQKGGDRMSDTSNLFACRTETKLDRLENEVEENTIVLAIVENLRDCLKGLPEDLTQEQKKIAFERAVDLFRIENCFKLLTSADYGLCCCRA